MQRIENNESKAAEFQKQIENYTKSVTEELLQIHIEQPHLPNIRCPKCKMQYLVIHDHIVKCPDIHCSWLQFRNFCGIQISLHDIESLVNTGRTSLIKGMKSKSGKTFNAHITLNDKAESSFEFEKVDRLISFKRSKLYLQYNS